MSSVEDEELADHVRGVKVTLDREDPRLVRREAHVLCLVSTFTTVSVTSAARPGSASPRTPITSTLRRSGRRIVMHRLLE
jgi:hypothetical protein